MRSRTFKTSDGVTLHCLEGGEGPAILFIPGFTFPAHVWQPQLDHFARTNRVVALDPRSHGESEKSPEGHYPARMAQDLYEAIEELKLAPVVLVAWAFACSQSLVYVRDHGTHQLKGLVLVDGFIGRDRTYSQVMSYLQFALRMQEDREGHAREFVRSSFVQHHRDEYLDDLTNALMKCPTSSAVALVASYQTLGNLSPILTTIDVPLMYVAIEEKREQAEVVRRHAPTARIEFVESAGHALFVDQPSRFNHSLQTFMSNL